MYIRVCVCVWGRLGTLFEAQQSIQFISVRLIFKLHLKNWSQMGAIYEQKRDGKTDQAHLVGYFYENAADFRSTTDSTKRIRQWEQAHLIRQLVNLLRVIWFESKAHTHSICSFISKGHQLPLNTTLAFHANYKQTLNSFWFPNIFFCFESNFALCNVKCWLLLLHAHFVSSHQFTFVNDDVRQRPAPMLVFWSIHTNTNKVCVCVCVGHTNICRIICVCEWINMNIRYDTPWIYVKGGRMCSHKLCVTAIPFWCHKLPNPLMYTFGNCIDSIQRWHAISLFVGAPSAACIIYSLRPANAIELSGIEDRQQQMETQNTELNSILILSRLQMNSYKTEWRNEQS